MVSLRSTSPGRRIVSALLVVLTGGLLLFSQACRSETGGADVAEPDSLEVEANAPSSYRVALAGALVDTLSGRARFGRVIDPATNRQFFLIELESQTDFAGGFFIARPDTVPPVAGTYDLAPPKPRRGETPQQVEARSIRLMYRQDLMRDLKATSGTLHLRHVSDTLISGTFNAVLYGRVRRGLEGDEMGEVSARGRFSARAGTAGYAIGL